LRISRHTVRWAAPILGLAVVAAGVWLFVFRESPADRVGRLMNAAKEAVDLFEYTRAELLIQEAIQRMPNSPLLHHNLATVLVRDEKWDAAREEFARAAALYGPEANEVRAEELFQVAQIDVHQGHLENAAGALEQAIVSHPQRAPLHTQLIDLQLSLQNVAGADSSTRRFLRLCGRTPDNLTAVARVHYRRNSWKMSLELAQAAAQANDSLIAAHVLVAKSYWKMGHAAEGLRYLEGPMARYPTAVDLWVARASLDVGVARYDDGLRSVDRALQIHPHHYDAHRTRLMVLFAANRLQEALQQAQLCRSMVSSEDEKHFLDSMIARIGRRMRGEPDPRINEMGAADGAAEGGKKP
jgi:tetratricopeptide (TPR) repeat protein